MIGGLPYKTKQFFFLLIKLSIVAGAFYFIYHKLTSNPEINFSEFVSFLSKNEIFSLKNILLLLLLTFFNWFFEILKWKNLVSVIKNISFFESMEQSLGALTASLFTPNRIGEYGAKIIYYSLEFRKRILLLNLLGNMVQMIVTSSFGIIGILVFVNTYDVDIPFNKLSLLLLVIVFITGILLLNFRDRDFKIKGFSLQKIKDFIIQLRTKIHILNFLFSVIRYFLFSFQFYLLLRFFKCNIGYFDAMVIITSMYLLVSIIPTIFLIDVVVKGGVAVYLFSFLNVNELTILSVITIMWILNFVLPSIFGSYHVLNFNWNKLEDQ